MWWKISEQKNERLSPKLICEMDSATGEIDLYLYLSICMFFFFSNFWSPLLELEGRRCPDSGLRVDELLAEPQQVQEPHTHEHVAEVNEPTPQHSPRPKGWAHPLDIIAPELPNLNDYCVPRAGRTSAGLLTVIPSPLRPHGEPQLLKDLSSFWRRHEVLPKSSFNPRHIQVK